MKGCSRSLRGGLTSIGSRIAMLPAEEHDRLCAWISHVPQMISTALAAALVEEFGDEAPLLPAGGRALQEMTRISASPYSMWRDIAITNKTNLERTLWKVEQRLAHIRENLATRQLAEEFEQAHQLRKAPRRRGSSSRALIRLQDCERQQEHPLSAGMNLQASVSGGLVERVAVADFVGGFPHGVKLIPSRKKDAERESGIIVPTFCRIHRLGPSGPPSGLATGLPHSTGEGSLPCALRRVFLTASFMPEQTSSKAACRHLQGLMLPAQVGCAELVTRLSNECWPRRKLNCAEFLCVQFSFRILPL